MCFLLRIFIENNFIVLWNMHYLVTCLSKAIFKTFDTHAIIYREPIKINVFFYNIIIALHIDRIYALITVIFEGEFIYYT